MEDHRGKAEGRGRGEGAIMPAVDLRPSFTAREEACLSPSDGEARPTECSGVHLMQAVPHYVDGDGARSELRMAALALESACECSRAEAVRRTIRLAQAADGVERAARQIRESRRGSTGRKSVFVMELALVKWIINLNVAATWCVRLLMVMAASCPEWTEAY